MSRLCIASLYGPRVSLHAATSMMAPALLQPGRFDCKWCLFKQWCDFIQLADLRKQFLLKMASLEAASRVVVGLRPGLPPFAGADPVTPSRRQTGRRLHFAIAGPGFHVVRAFAAVPWLRSCQSACVMAPPGRGSQITICIRVLFGLRQLPSGYGPWHLPVPGRAPIRGDSGVLIGASECPAGSRTA